MSIIVLTENSLQPFSQHPSVFEVRIQNFPYSVVALCLVLGTQYKHNKCSLSKSMVLVHRSFCFKRSTPASLPSSIGYVKACLFTEPCQTLLSPLTQGQDLFSLHKVPCEQQYGLPLQGLPLYSCTVLAPLHGSALLFHTTTCQAGLFTAFTSHVCISKSREERSLPRVSWLGSDRDSLVTASDMGFTRS